MKLIAIDLDGTTLNSNKEISRETAQAIKEVQQRGHIVMILSGRPSSFIEHELSKHGLECPIGGSNGTELIAEGKIIKLSDLTTIQGQRIAMELDAEEVPYNITTDKGTFTSRKWSERLNGIISSGNVLNEYKLHKDYHMITTPPESYGNKFFKNSTEIIKKGVSIHKFMLLTLEPEKKARITSKLELIKDTYITSSSPFNLEVMHIDGNKGNGLRKMAEHFQIPLEQTIAIGDEKNDLPMFKVAGVSIAMGNAELDIKKQCDHVTLTNDENGVAHAMKKYINESFSPI